MDDAMTFLDEEERVEQGRCAQDRPNRPERQVAPVCASNASKVVGGGLPHCVSPLPAPQVSGALSSQTTPAPTLMPSDPRHAQSALALQEQNAWQQLLQEVLHHQNQQHNLQQHLQHLQIIQLPHQYHQFHHQAFVPQGLGHMQMPPFTHYAALSNNILSHLLSQTVQKAHHTPQQPGSANAATGS